MSEGDNSGQASMKVGYVSCFTFSLLEPIDLLVQALESAQTSPPNEVHASARENGLSVSIIALVAIMVESAIGRVHYDVLQGRKPETAKRFSALKFFREQFGDGPEEAMLQESLNEIFAIRDAIAHAHLYEDDIQLDESGGMYVSAPQLGKCYGDTKRQVVMNPQTRGTKRLGVNLFPTRICRSDVVIVLREAVRILVYLERKGSRFVNTSAQTVPDGGRWTKLVDYPERLATRWKVKFKL